MTTEDISITDTIITEAIERSERCQGSMNTQEYDSAIDEIDIAEEGAETVSEHYRKQAEDYNRLKKFWDSKMTILGNRRQSLKRRRSKIISDIYQKSNG